MSPDSALAKTAIPQERGMRAWRRVLWSAIVLGVPLAWLFGRALLTDELPVYRDAAHYYYPLYHLVAGEWEAGRLPLWNPYDGLGEPLAADATAAVFYPGKLIFALPLGYDANYKLYIVAHVLLCGVTALMAARGFHRSWPAATLCALSYAFSGSVLFGYCNVVYLVGAAWLPLALLAIDRTLVRRNWRWAIALGVVLALMIFGGDPQLAYHAGLVAALYCIVLCCRGGQNTTARERNRSKATYTGWRRLLLLVFAGATAFLLAAVQILPSAEWARHSTRAHSDSARNIYELFALASYESPSRDLRPSFLLAALAPRETRPPRVNLLLGQLQPGHHEDSYQFSVAPWHLATFIWPNCLGQEFPTHTRWINALPAEGGAWTPTLYMGLLPLVLALSQMRLGNGRARLPPSQYRNLPGIEVAAALARREPRPPRRTPRICWLSWTALIAVLASFGWYGVGWVVGEVLHVAGRDAASPLGAPFGGPYWLMQTLLPGYVMFRYPAKWLVVAAMALSLLAAFGWDRAIAPSLSADAPRRCTAALTFVRRALLIIVGVTVALLGITAAAMSVFSWWNELASLVPADPLFGPFDRSRAAAAVIYALLHTLAVAGLMLCILARSASEGGAAIGSESGHGVPTGGDDADRASASEPAMRLARLVPVFPRLRFGLVSCILLLLTAIDLAIAQRNLVPTAPAESWGAASPLVTSIQKIKPLQGTPSAHDPPARLWRISPPLPDQWKMTTSLDRQRVNQAWDRQALHPRYHLLERLNVLNAHGSLQLREVAAFLDRQRRARLKKTGVKFVIAPASQGPPGFTPGAQSEFAVESVAVQLFQSDGNSQRAWIEAQATPSWAGSLTSGQCRIVRYEPGLVEVDAELHEPGILVLSDLSYPGWNCFVEDRIVRQKIARREEIEPMKGALRGVRLPAGKFRVTFRYGPMSFAVGAAISILAWAALLVLAATVWLRRLLRRRTSGAA
jgi:hypothetical protein